MSTEREQLAAIIHDHRIFSDTGERCADAILAAGFRRPEGEKPRVEPSAPDEQTLWNWIDRLGRAAGDAAILFHQSVGHMELRRIAQEHERTYDAIRAYLLTMVGDRSEFEERKSAVPSGEAPASPTDEGEPKPARERFDALMAGIEPGKCLHGHLFVAVEPCIACMKSDEATPRFVLDFCEGAIRDAIYTDDGLDGATGEAVLAMIRDAKAASRSPAPSPAREAADGWGVLDAKGHVSCLTQLRREAEDAANGCDENYPEDAPHIVVDLVRRVKSASTPAGSFGYCAICYNPLDCCSHCNLSMHPAMPEVSA